MDLPARSRPFAWPAPSGSSSEPGAERARAVFEQRSIREHALGTGGERGSPKGGIVVLPDRDDPRSRAGCDPDGLEPVVGPRRQVDDRETGARCLLLNARYQESLE